MLERICIGLIVVLLAASVRAGTIVEQDLPTTWLTATMSSAFCSPCLPSQPGSRMYASFDLGQDAVIDAARFPVFTNPFGLLGDFTVSLWANPLDPSGPLVQTLVREGEYARFIGSRGYIDIRLPEWNLAAGSYWLSVFGVNGDSFQWGGVFDAGDDRRFVNGVVTVGSPTAQPLNYLLGFSLQGRESVVTTPIGGTLPLLAGGLGLLALTRRRRSG